MLSDNGWPPHVLQRGHALSTWGGWLHNIMHLFLFLHKIENQLHQLNECAILNFVKILWCFRPSMNAKFSTLWRLSTFKYERAKQDLAKIFCSIFFKTTRCAILAGPVTETALSTSVWGQWMPHPISLLRAPGDCSRSVWHSEREPRGFEGPFKSAIWAPVSLWWDGDDCRLGSTEDGEYHCRWRTRILLSYLFLLKSSGITILMFVASLSFARPFLV